MSAHCIGTVNNRNERGHLSSFIKLNMSGFIHKSFVWAFSVHENPVNLEKHFLFSATLLGQGLIIPWRTFCENKSFYIIGIN